MVYSHSSQQERYDGPGVAMPERNQRSSDADLVSNGRVKCDPILHQLLHPNVGRCLLRRYYLSLFPPEVTNPASQSTPGYKHFTANTSLLQPICHLVSLLEVDIPFEVTCTPSSPPLVQTNNNFTSTVSTYTLFYCLWCNPNIVH